MSLCICPEWEPNIKEVNVHLMNAVARNPHHGIRYNGVPFRYCPWCGRWLCVDEEDAALRRRREGQPETQEVKQP